MGACFSTTGTHKGEDGQKVGARKGDLKLKKGNFGGAVGGLVDERALQLIPGRLCGNGASSICSLYTQQGKKGTNQDAMIVWENFSSRHDTVFCGVFDGHGPYGHMVARRVRDTLPVLLSIQWKSQLDGDNLNHVNENGNTDSNHESTNLEDVLDEDWSEQLQNGEEEREKPPEMYLPLKRSLLKAFKLMDKELKLHPTIDCFCSGTTAVSLVKQGEDILIANVGDSRAILASKDKDDNLIATQLTVDLKPNLPREAARIQECKGRVFALQDEPDVARVWLPNSDSPGLAMARAFGDFCLKDFGLISVPDVYYHRITDRDEFVVLATDGVWDVLSNKEVVDIVASAPARSTAARALVDCATRSWRLKYPTSKNDDCAAICLFLEHMSPPDASESTEQEIVKEGALSSVTDSEISVTAAPQFLEYSGTTRELNEIVPAIDDVAKDKDKNLGASRRSLAECISTSEEEEWSALDGVTRVNSLLSIPRFLYSGDKRSASWRKWL